MTTSHWQQTHLHSPTLYGDIGKTLLWAYLYCLQISSWLVFVRNCHFLNHGSTTYFLSLISMEQSVSERCPNFNPSRFLPHFHFSRVNIVFKPTHCLNCSTSHHKRTGITRRGWLKSQQSYGSKLTRNDRLGGRAVPAVPPWKRKLATRRPPAGPAAGKGWPPGWPDGTPGKAISAFAGPQGVGDEAEGRGAGAGLGRRGRARRLADRCGSQPGAIGPRGGRQHGRRSQDCLRNRTGPPLARPPCAHEIWQD